MYHRFNENKYPSTNIRINDFKEHLKIIEQENIKFINTYSFKIEFSAFPNIKKKTAPPITAGVI